MHAVSRPQPLVWQNEPKGGDFAKRANDFDHSGRRYWIGRGDCRLHRIYIESCTQAVPQSQPPVWQNEPNAGDSSRAANNLAISSTFILDALGHRLRDGVLACGDVGSRLCGKPYCVGIWAYPHHAVAVAGAHELVPIFTTHAAMPEPAAHRSVVASVSAGLPKKDWPLLLSAMEQLSDLERVIVLARSNGLEHVPDEVAQRAAAQNRPPSIRINVPRAEVFKLLSRTSVLLYTVTPHTPLGMPMSVIEGLRAGACVVTPDRPEMRDLCGNDGFRPYCSVADIVAHVREVTAGGPAIEAERRRNREYAVTRFCGMELGRRFHAELSDAVTAWRLRA
jgi:glycosyltransferase involved in cell wall biosynthesis